MTQHYSERFKARMVSRLLAGPGMTATALSEEVGVPAWTLSRWRKEAAMVSRVSGDGEQDSPPSVAPDRPSRRPEDWSPEEKLKVVIESAGLSDEELGAFLRSRGLHEAQLNEWRNAARVALGGRAAEPAKASLLRKRIKELEREIARKDKALAETAALLVLKKKLENLWEDEEDDTTKDSDE